MIKKTKQEKIRTNFSPITKWFKKLKVIGWEFNPVGYTWKLEDRKTKQIHYLFSASETMRKDIKNDT